MVMCHDNLKQRVVPANKGVAYCPLPDSPDISILEEPAAPRGQQFRRPARLQQNINININNNIKNFFIVDC